MQRAVWQEEAVVGEDGFDENQNPKAPYVRPKVKAPWDNLSMTSSMMMEEEAKKEAARNVRVRQLGDLGGSVHSQDLDAAFEKELAAQEYTMKTPWAVGEAHEDSVVIKGGDHDPAKKTLIKDYKYTSMWETPPLSQARLEQIASYNAGDNCPFQREDNIIKVEKKAPRKTGPPKAATLAPWQHGSQPGDAIPTPAFPIPATSLWTMPKEEKKIEAVESSGDPILDQLRQQLKNSGANGILGLARKFKIMDDDQSGTLDEFEFRKGLKECRLDLTERQIKHLFGYFDKDDSGSITYEEFLVGIRGVLNARRREMVHMAYDVLDRDGSGEVDMEDMKLAYNAKGHPDVVAGRRTEEEVLREIIDVFDCGSGPKDGKVTLAEFESYYSNISASVDSDDYFELMMRNAWHISGGEGACANTTNKRVLVTHADGTQTVEEVKNDMGLKKGDKKGLVQRLREQGIHAATINENGATDGSNGRGGDGSSSSSRDPSPRNSISNSSSSAKILGGGGGGGGSGAVGAKPKSLAEIMATAAAANPAPVASVIGGSQPGSRRPSNASSRR